MGILKDSVISLFVVVQSLSCVQLFATPWTAALQASLSFTIFQSLMPSSHLLRCRPLLLLPSILPSIRVFFSESTICIKCSKYWSFSISPSNEYSGLIPFRVDWLDHPRDSQESSPTPQFKSINSLALSLLHSPTLTSISDHWKNHSFD